MNPPRSSFSVMTTKEIYDCLDIHCMQALQYDDVRLAGEWKEGRNPLFQKWVLKSDHEKEDVAWHKEFQRLVDERDDARVAFASAEARHIAVLESLQRENEKLKKESDDIKRKVKQAMAEVGLESKDPDSHSMFCRRVERKLKWLPRVIPSKGAGRET